MAYDNRRRKDLKEDMRTVWIDIEHRILSFHPFPNGKQRIYTEDVFWNQVVSLIELGYRVM